MYTIPNEVQLSLIDWNRVLKRDLDTFELVVQANDIRSESIIRNELQKTCTSIEELLSSDSYDQERAEEIKTHCFYIHRMLVDAICKFDDQYSALEADYRELKAQIRVCFGILNNNLDLQRKFTTLNKLTLFKGLLQSGAGTSRLLTEDERSRFITRCV